MVRPPVASSSAIHFQRLSRLPSLLVSGIPSSLLLFKTRLLYTALTAAAPAPTLVAYGSKNEQGHHYSAGL